MKARISAIPCRWFTWVLLFLALSSRGSTNYVSLTGAHISPFDSWNNAATNIQAAVDAAVDGDLILIAPGRYLDQIKEKDGPTRVVVDKAVTLRGDSTNREDVVIVGTETIGGWPDQTNFPARCIWMTENSRLENLSVYFGVPGTNYFGGCVYGFSSTTLTNCVISSGFAIAGGGVYRCSVYNSRVMHCGAYDFFYRTSSNGEAIRGWGAGAAEGTYVDCIFGPYNDALYGGGAVSSSCTRCVFTQNYGVYGAGLSDSLATNCVFSSNMFADMGGGMFQGRAFDCVFTNNTAREGSAVYGGVVEKGTIAMNSGMGGCAMSNATGVFVVVENNYNHLETTKNSTLLNCTLRNNVAESGGGAGRGSRLFNCLVYDNFATFMGGGLYDCYAVNCTIVRNLAPSSLLKKPLSRERGARSGAEFFELTKSSCG